MGGSKDITYIPPKLIVGSKKNQTFDSPVRQLLEILQFDLEVIDDDTGQAKI